MFDFISSLVNNGFSFSTATSLIAWAVGFLVLVFLFRYLLEKWRRKAIIKDALQYITLKIVVPKKASQKDKEDATEKDFKEAVGVMEQLFNSLHSIYSGSYKRRFFGQTAISLEIVAQNKMVDFYVVVPLDHQQTIEKQLTSFYPDVFVEAVPSYNIFQKDSYQECAYLKQKKDPAFPISVYEDLDTDPLNNIVNILSKLTKEEGAVIQILIRPKGSAWSDRARKVAKNIFEGKGPQGFWRGIMKASSKEESKEPKRLTPMEEERVKKIENKASKMGFDVMARIVTSSPTAANAKMHLRNIISSFHQLNAPNLNSFQIFWPKSSWQVFWQKKKILYGFILRVFLFGGKSMVLSSEELATVFHLPDIRFNKSPVIKWHLFKIAPAPNNLPDEGVLLGYNVYRGESREIKLQRNDRFRHFYVIGQTGTGKSSILLNMARQDVRNGDGVCVMDPHGDLAEDLIKYIPKERAEDVIYFNPADTNRPLGINMLEVETDDQKDYIATELLNIMIRLYDEEIFGPRIQDYFRNGVLTLMDYPGGGALTDIVKLFTDEDFQKRRVEHVKNPVVKDWWTRTFNAMGQREKQEMIPYFQAKFSSFISNDLMRNIIGQSKSAFNFSDAMQEGKIVLINLSKGLIGEFNMKLLGMMITAKFQAAAMRRAIIAREERKDFFLYLDEFQNFVTESIESILSEARKYRLSLNIAHQYINQLMSSKQDEKVKNAVFGNIGTMVSYKISAEDGKYMAEEFAPVYSEQDLINLDAFKAVIKLCVNGQPTTPFSLVPVNPYLEKGNDKLASIIKELSRLKYGREKKFVEQEIYNRLEVV